MVTSVKQLIAAANADVPRVSPAEARDLIRNGALVVDVRDGTEVQQSGRVSGAIHVPRGILEFRADPESATHDMAFARDRTIIVYCASGGRAALGGKTLKDLGYESVYNLGGFKDWADSGGAIERPIAFTDNDRPGIMLASAVRSYINRYAVLPGRSAYSVAIASLM